MEVINPAPTASATAASRPVQLTAGAWRQTGLLVSTTGADKIVATADLFAHVSPGKLDQLATFGADGTYTLLKGGASQPKQGTWRLSAGSDSLTITLPDHMRRLAVAELTASSLRLTFTDAASSGAVSTYTATYAH